MSLAMGDMAPEKIVDCAVRCGMKGIDWITLHNTSAKRLKTFCDDAGLAVAAHTPLNQDFVQGVSDGMEEFKRSLEDAVALGAPIIMVPPFPFAHQKSMEEARKQWIDFYRRALVLAQKAGLMLCVESTGFLNSPISAGAELLEAVTSVPGLKIAFDNGNTATADDMVTAFETVKNHVTHFHLKDWQIFDTPEAGTDLKRTGKYYRDCVIGDGSLPLIPFLQEHVMPCYDGFCNLECFDPSGKLTPAQVMQRATAFLKKNHFIE